MYLTLLHVVLPLLAGAFLSLGYSNDPNLIVLYGRAWNLFNFEGSGLGSWVGADFVFLRFVRLIRLQRFLRDKDSFESFQLELGIEPNKIKPWQLQLARATSSILSLLFISSGCLFEAEPQISDYFEGATTTAATPSHPTATPPRPRSHAHPNSLPTGAQPSITQRARSPRSVASHRRLPKVGSS